MVRKPARRRAWHFSGQGSIACLLKARKVRDGTYLIGLPSVHDESGHAHLLPARCSACLRLRAGPRLLRSWRALSTVGCLHIHKGTEFAHLCTRHSGQPKGMQHLLQGNWPHSQYGTWTDPKVCVTHWKTRGAPPVKGLPQEVLGLGRGEGASPGSAAAPEPPGPDCPSGPAAQRPAR